MLFDIFNFELQKFLFNFEISKKYLDLISIIWNIIYTKLTHKNF